MAVLKCYRATDMSDVSVGYGIAREATSTRLVVANSTSVSVYTGEGFTYDQIGVTGGTITRFQLFEDGKNLVNLTGISLDAKAAFDLLADGSNRDLYEAVFSGDDRMSGSSGGDVLLAFAGRDRIDGGRGADLISGGTGHDTITGGANADKLYGGEGYDDFVFTSVTQSRPGEAQRDKIYDFEHFLDDLDLSAIDASTLQSGDQAFNFIRYSPFTAEGQVRVQQVGDHTLVEMNTTGTSGAEMRVWLMNHDADTFRNFDMIL